MVEGVVVRYARLGHFALGASEWSGIVLLVLIVIVVESGEE